MNQNRLDTNRLRDRNVKDNFILELHNRYEVLANRDDQLDGTEELWTKIKDIYQETGKNVLGFKKRHKKDCMSEETWLETDRRKEIKLLIKHNAKQN